MQQFINPHSTVGNILSAYGPNIPWTWVIDHLKNSLVGTTCHIDTTVIGSIPRFRDELDLCDSGVDTVIITDEKWKFPDDADGINHYESALLAHANMQNKDIIILTCRYTNRRVGPRCWVVSYPAWFLSSHFYTPLEAAIKPRGLDYGFSSLNSRPAVHRILLGYRLYEQDLLDEVIFSLGCNGSFDANIIKTLPDFEQFRQLLPIRVYDTRLGDYTVNNHPAYSHAYCNIVTETETDMVIDVAPGANLVEHEIITEKSYKPFLSCQVPLFLASRGHYAYLKSLGFEVMEDLVPLGYDQMPTVDKVAAIVNIVGQGREFIEDFYFAHRGEIEHNYALATGRTVEQQLIADILLFKSAVPSTP